MEKQVALTTCHGAIVAAETAIDDWVLRANRGRVLGWEVLTLVGVGAGQIALRTRHGFYVSALPEEEDWRLAGNRLRVQECERFTPIEVGRYVVLRTAHGRFVSAKSDDEGWVLRADSVEIGVRERFGGGEVESAPPDGAPAGAFVPFKGGAFTWSGPLVPALRALTQPPDAPAAASAELRPAREPRSPGRIYNRPFPTPSGELWL